jgi:hypothetical protein
MSSKPEETGSQDKINKAINKDSRRKTWWMPRISHIAVAVAVVAVGVAISAHRNRSPASVPSPVSVTSPVPVPSPESVPPSNKEDANQAFLQGNMLYEKVSITVALSLAASLVDQ